MYKIFALTTRGLETVSAAEIASIPGVTVNKLGYRRIAAACGGSLTALLELRTVDDVFLDVATWSDIGRPRSALAAIGESGARLDLEKAAAVCSEIRPIRKPPRFSVTANFVGKRNYNTDEIKTACAEGIAARRRGWKYARDDADADLNVRVFIEHDVAYVGVRLGQRPLYRRSYKTSHVPGSLKPSVAAALLYLAQVSPGMLVLDPCCGAGTILVEAALCGASPVGGDVDPDALAATQTNVVAAGIAARVQRWDAQALPIAGRSIGRIVCNLPWGREVSVDVALRSHYKHIGADMQRVLSPCGRIVLLTSAPHLVDLELRCEKQIEISLFGQTPTVMVFDAKRTRA